MSGGNTEKNTGTLFFGNEKVTLLEAPNSKLRVWLFLNLPD